MPYETGTATDKQDLLSKLSTFAQADGWTEDVFDTVTNRHLAIHKGTVFVQFRYDTSTPHIAIFQSLAYSGASPGNQTDDSGNGQSGTGAITAGRRMSDIGNGPFTAYYFFGDGTNIHVTLEFQPGLFRHVSFGTVTKVGVWTGGEYCCGHKLNVGQSHDMTDSRHTILFDATHQHSSDSTLHATVHCEGLPDEGGTSKWGVVGTATTAFNAGVDRASIARYKLHGGIRGGFWQNAMGWLQANPANGFLPMFPIALYSRKPTVTPEEFRLLGYIPNARFINVKFVAPGEEFTLGSDVWKCFPWVRKVDVSVVGQESTGHMGIAVRKIV